MINVDDNFVSNAFLPKIDKSLIENQSENTDSSFNEEISDNCYSNLMKNGENRCITSDECFEYYLNPEASGNIKLIKVFIK